MALIKMILLIGLLIFVHELGHFLVAKMFKMKVERFCFGLPFGPVLFEKKIGDVTYGVHLLFFLGGYVSFPDDEENPNLPNQLLQQPQGFWLLDAKASFFYRQSF